MKQKGKAAFVIRFETGNYVDMNHNDFSIQETTWKMLEYNGEPQKIRIEEIEANRENPLTRLTSLNYKKIYRLFF